VVIVVKTLRLFYVCILLFLIFGVTEAGAKQQDMLEEIDRYLKEQMKEQAIQGLAYVIVKNDEIIQTNAFGNADIGRQLTVKTPMKLASLSKSFTALAVMQLVEQGRIELDTPVKTYIPSFKLKDKEASEAITIRQLLNQTSGISADGEIEIANELKGKSLEETVSLLSRVKLSHSVGTTFEYTNLNYLVLGLVIEKVSGKSLNEYLEDYILGPLEMKNSYTSIKLAEKDGLSKSYSSWLGMHLPTKTLLDDLPNFLASGYMVSSAEDMGKYLRFFINGGGILSDRGIEILQTPASNAKMYLDGEFFGTYAMGWWQRNVQGTKVIGHSGDLFSAARTDMYILSEENIGVVVLTNTNNGRFTPGDSHISTDGVISILSGKTPKSEDHSQEFKLHYLIFNSILCLFIGLLLFFAIRLRKRSIKLDSNWAALFMILQLVIPVSLWLLLPVLLQIPSWSFLFAVQPDLVTAVLAILFTVFILGIYKLWRAILSHKRQRPKTFTEKVIS
jgi:CubicO group peptidase (beta-lactamase class C family)